MGDKFNQFYNVLKASKKILILTGAGISAESGIPVFRGTGGFWRKYKAQEVATPEAFFTNPSLVWEFYHYRRQIAFKAKPNPAHITLAKYETICENSEREFNIITQNVDGLHYQAGNKNILELHGSLRKVKCTNPKCHFVDFNEDMVICPALEGKGDPNQEDSAPIPKELLPKCKKCSSLVRPHIVWFGENLDEVVLDKAYQLMENCDLCVVIGTSSIVYPAAMFAPSIAARGVPVAEFNITDTPATNLFQFHFVGHCGDTIPKAFDIKI